MKESLTLSAIFAVAPERVYKAWLNSREQSGMTGGVAMISAVEGGTFTAWDGYISGKNIELLPYSKIVQSWRTTEFDDEDEDSRLEITFKQVNEGCEITLHHTNIPEGQTQYKKGWEEYYFTPMKKYFGRERG